MTSTAKIIPIFAIASVLAVPATAQARHHHHHHGYSNAKLTKIVKHLAKTDKSLTHRVSVLEKQVASLSGNPPTNSALQAQIDGLKGQVGSVPNGEDLWSVAQGQNDSLNSLWNYSENWAQVASCLRNSTVQVGRYDSGGNPNVSTQNQVWLDYTAFHQNVSKNYVYNLVFNNGC